MAIINRAISWKTFFYLWLIFSTLTVVSNVTEDGLSKFSDILNLFLLALGVIAMYGLAYGKRIASRYIWRILFVFQAGFFVIAIVLVALSLIQGGSSSLEIFSETKSFIEVSLSVLLTVFIFGSYFYGLYLYSFKSDAIWGNDI